VEADSTSAFSWESTQYRGLVFYRAFALESITSKQEPYATNLTLTEKQPLRSGRRADRQTSAALRDCTSSGDTHPAATHQLASQNFPETLHPRSAAERFEPQ
jgi:hypothetical protein